MNTKQQFRVAVAGLDMRDVRLIEIVFKHSQYNRYEFVLVPECAPGEVDLVIVNTHDVKGKEAIQWIRDSRSPVPVIAAVPRGQSSDSRHAISIDRLTLQLLPIMNRVVELELMSPDTAPLPASVRAKIQASTDAAKVKNKSSTQAVSAHSAQAPKTAIAPLVAIGNSNNSPDLLDVATLIAPVVPGLPKSNASEIAPVSKSQISEIEPISAQKNDGLRSTQSEVQQEGKKDAPVVASLVNVDATPNTPGRSNLVAFPGSRDSKKNAARLRVLIVDDSPTVRLQMNLALEKMGFAPDAAVSAADALKRLDYHHYDLVILDLVMPDMNGFELIRAIRKDKRRQALPILVLSTKNSTFDRVRASLAGSDTFLNKPVPMQKLRHIMMRHLRKSLAIDDLSALLVPLADLTTTQNKLGSDTARLQKAL
jgi:CheY-like chemotaxis protein